MPGYVRAPVATDTFPVTLATKFTESLAVEANWNEYKDGTTQRQALVSGPRRTWSLSKRLTATDIVTLRTFWETHANEAFFFYNPPETSPPFTRTPSGSSGQYIVRFASDWSQSMQAVRGDIPDVQLVEVGPATGTQPPPVTTTGQPPVTAQSSVLSVTWAHIPNPAFTPTYGGFISMGLFSIFSPPNIFFDTAPWATRTDTFTNSQIFTALTGGTLSLLIGLGHIGPGGTTDPTLSPPDTLLLYDVFATITMSDGTLLIYRPSSFAQQVTAPVGSVSNGSGAVDGDPATAATISVTQYGGFVSGSFLNISGFAAA